MKISKIMNRYFEFLCQNTDDMSCATPCFLIIFVKNGQNRIVSSNLIKATNVHFNLLTKIIRHLKSSQNGDTHCLPMCSAKGSVPPLLSSSAAGGRRHTLWPHCLLSLGCALVAVSNFSSLRGTVKGNYHRLLNSSTQW